MSLIRRECWAVGKGGRSRECRSAARCCVSIGSNWFKCFHKFELVEWFDWLDWFELDFFLARLELYINNTFPKYLQSYFLEKLATNVSNHIFLKWRRMLTFCFQKCQQLQTSEMLGTNESNYILQKCWRQMLAIIILLEFSEMIATNVSNHNCQECWRQVLAIIILGNAGDKC